MTEDELLKRLKQIEQRLAALEAHAAAAAEVLAHAEQMLTEWQELMPVLRAVRIATRHGKARNDRARCGRATHPPERSIPSQS